MREEVRTVVINSASKASELSKALLKFKIMALGSINAELVTPSPVIRYKTASGESTLNLCGMSAQVVPDFISPIDVVQLINASGSWFVNDTSVYLSWSVAEIIFRRGSETMKRFCNRFCDHMMDQKTVLDTVKRLKRPFTKLTMTQLDSATARVKDLGYNARINIVDERFNKAMLDAKSFYHTEFINALQYEVGRLEFKRKDLNSDIQRYLNFGASDEAISKVGSLMCDITSIDSCQKELAAIVDSVTYQVSKLNDSEGMSLLKQPVKCAISSKGEWVD